MCFAHSLCDYNVRNNFNIQYKCFTPHHITLQLPGNGLNVIALLRFWKVFKSSFFWEWSPVLQPIDFLYCCSFFSAGSTNFTCVGWIHLGFLSVTRIIWYSPSNFGCNGVCKCCGLVTRTHCPGATLWPPGPGEFKSSITCFLPVWTESLSLFSNACL